MNVYARPDLPGAPQVGDVVVVVLEYPEDSIIAGPHEMDGCIGCVVCVDGYHRHPWGVLRSDGRADYVHLVRWPTPEEVAVYQLSRGAP